MKTVLSLLFILIASSSCTAQEIPDREMQMETAILAAPEGEGTNATILGYDINGKVVTLKEGNNNYVCLADNPKKDGLNVSCYFKGLEPFMARGRALRAEGKSMKEIVEIRGNEVASRQLEIPKNSTAYILTGKYNKESKLLSEGHLRYVVYIPYQTSESTGLPLKPVTPGGPWIMDPGTHRAHIMITPPKK